MSSGLYLLFNCYVFFNVIGLLSEWFAYYLSILYARYFIEKRQNLDGSICENIQKCDTIGTIYFSCWCFGK
jgi:hypothetical protein